MKIKSSHELIEEANRDLELLKQQIYIEGEYLVLDIAYEYDIELSRINTPEKLLQWVHHLSEKTWINTRHLWFIIEIIAEHCKFKGIPHGSC